VPVYTIGAGRDGLVLMPVSDENGNKIGYRRAISDLDENTLHEIADATGGKFFRAMDINTAEKAFAAIDKAQKIEFTAKSYLLTTEMFHWFAVPGAVLLFLGALFALPPSLPRWNAASGRVPSASGTPRSTPAPTA
jgi:Ca-activated chloride channel family protein